MEPPRARPTCGKLAILYCFEGCDGALAERKEYDTVTSTKLISDKRYEYDGLKLLRVDERCDADGDGEVEAGETSWRTLEAATYGPGIVGNLLGKLVYTHTNGDATPDSQADYYYHYDHVGNVYLVTDDEGEEVYRFAQDAFGNELDFGNYTGDSWATASAPRFAVCRKMRSISWTPAFAGVTGPDRGDGT